MPFDPQKMLAQLASYSSLLVEVENYLYRTGKWATAETIIAELDLAEQVTVGELRSLMGKCQGNIIGSPAPNAFSSTARGGITGYESYRRIREEFDKRRRADS